jgi:hypothetical protein
VQIAATILEATKHVSFATPVPPAAPHSPRQVVPSKGLSSAPGSSTAHPEATPSACSDAERTAALPVAGAPPSLPSHHDREPEPLAAGSGPAKLLAQTVEHTLRGNSAGESVAPPKAKVGTSTGHDDNDDTDASIEEVSFSDFGRCKRKVRVHNAGSAPPTAGASTLSPVGDDHNGRTRRMVHAAPASFMRHFGTAYETDCRDGSSGAARLLSEMQQQPVAAGNSLALSGAECVRQVADELAAREGAKSGALKDDGRVHNAPKDTALGLYDAEVGHPLSVRERYSHTCHAQKGLVRDAADPEFLGDVTMLPLVRRRQNKEGQAGWGRSVCLEANKRPRNKPKAGFDTIPFDYDAHAAEDAGRGRRLHPRDPQGGTGRHAGRNQGRGARSSGRGRHRGGP